MNLDRAEKTGFWVGVAAFAAVAAVLFFAHRIVSNHLDGEWADLILAVPAFLAVFLIFPIRDRYVVFSRRQYCKKHGHILEIVESKAGERTVLCKRCFSAMKSESAATSASPQKKQSFEVRIADNFHYMDESETYAHGRFATWAEAVAASKTIVDRCLAEYRTPGMTADSLFSHYTSFGDDPHIHPVPEGEHFSAWDYAKERCTEICT